jgi:O-antigen ligase/tetratricopeptide (TPR) repeat protein
LNSSNFIAPFFLILYFCIGFIPNWGAVDKIAPQWLGMNILNGIVILYILFNSKYFLGALSKLLGSKLTLLYGFFILWAAGSYFYALNQTEQLVNISRQGNVFLMYCCMLILLSGVKNKIGFSSWVLVTILTVEIYYVLVQAIDMINTRGLIASSELKGVTANRNITAFSLAIKTPFLYYLIHTQKKPFIKISLVLLSFAVFLGLMMIQSRASFLATGFGIASFLGALVFIGFQADKKHVKKLIFSASGVLLALLMAITINQTVLKDKGADAVARAATIGAITTDDSITARIRYYTDVLNQFKSSPIFGVGLGNWKLKSIDFDKYNIKGYVVPYHAHSDFIQLGAELGLFGFLSYLGIFFLTIFFAFKLAIKNTEKPLEQRLFIFLLLVALGIYSVDASLNFPIARPQVLVVWTLILALISFYYYEEKEKQPLKGISRGFLWMSLFLLLPSLYVSNSVYNSLKGQMFLLQDFNSNNYNVPLNQVDNIVPDMPNITVTTIPINSVKARYYVKAKKYDKALALLDNGTDANPYLFYSEILKSQIFQEQGKLDSAKIYARKAFFGLPNNDLHASRYINLINITRDKKALKEAFELLTYKNKLVNWKNYLIVANGISNIKDPILIERAKKATEIFPNNREIKNLYNQIAVGKGKLNESIYYSKTGLDYFNKGDFQKAAIEFEKAIEANPLDYAHFENAATANYMIGNLEKAEEQIDMVINDLNPLNGKCEYIKALIYIKMGDPIGACPYLATARDSGFSQAVGIFQQYCN